MEPALLILQVEPDSEYPVATPSRYQVNERDPDRAQTTAEAPKTTRGASGSLNRDRQRASRGSKSSTTCELRNYVQTCELLRCRQMLSA